MKELSNLFKKHGFVHGKSKFSIDQINTFHKEFYPIFETKRKRFQSNFKKENSLAANHDINRWNMLLPSDSQMMKSAFYADDEIFTTLKSIFDGDFALVFFSSDIASPGSTFQTIHQDTNDFGVALNVPLVDSDEVNGATQIFTDTHIQSKNSTFSNESNTFSDDEIISRAKNQVPNYLNVKKGDYTLRDLRLIHRGTPNLTNKDRPYLSSIFLPTYSNEVPDFEAINYGWKTFNEFKKEAFSLGRIDLIDYANTFGRLIIIGSNSDRINRPIPKNISNKLDENALYCLRYALFEDKNLNNKIKRCPILSSDLLREIENAKNEFNDLKNK